jgi:hypothetical protein
VPGIDFIESYVPVINDVSFRIILIGMMVWNLKAKIIDIETTSLHGDLEEESIFMEIPSDMGVGDGKCLVLKKTMYGIEQSARQFYVKLVKALQRCGFTGSLADSCLWFKQSNIGKIMISIYVDDCLIIRSDEGIKGVIEALKNHDFGLHIEEYLKDY